MRRLLAIILASILVAPMIPSALQADEYLTPVRVQLKWFHQFQFAGFYAAVEQGYFREAGLDVTLLEGGPHVNPTQEVLDGRAEFGVGTSGLLITRSRGLPVVAVAAIFQHSPYILIARDDPEITSPRDLEGRTIMVEPYSEELLAYLHREGVDSDRINMIEHTGDPLEVVDGEVVGMTAYLTTEPFFLARAGETYRVFDPKVAGIDFYGDTLFTMEDYAERNNNLVVAFREALVRGWTYAFNHQEEIIALIEREYSPESGRDFLRFEADNIRRLLIPDLIEIGYMNPARWATIAQEFEAAGLMQRPVDIDAFMFHPAEPADWRWLLYTLLISGLVMALSAIVLLKFYSLNRALRAEVHSRKLLEVELRERALTDPVTGTLNRHGFLEAMAREMERAARHDAPLSLLELDLDHFKRINDTHGHAAGDRILNFVGAICRAETRGIDITARIGGEEFMITLPDTDSGG
ncbi:GGDEF domain-containing protein, partial [Thioalkalivibrio denitrificans]|uniref:GGDEF domain-containing protein n=1 Tax=Thioalkalivibrio denitrificans TaxID=108003 RepID=UPI001588F1AC